MYRIGGFAGRIGGSVSTVRWCEAGGCSTPRRTTTGQRYVEDSDVRRALQLGVDEAVRRTVGGCRVSSPSQKEDLASRIVAMEQFCRGRGPVVDEWVTGIGGGMNLTRRELLAVMDATWAGCEIALILSAIL